MADATLPSDQSFPVVKKFGELVVNIDDESLNLSRSMNNILNTLTNVELEEYGDGLESLNEVFSFSQIADHDRNSLDTKPIHKGLTCLNDSNKCGGTLIVSMDHKFNEADAKKVNLKNKASVGELHLNCAVTKFEVIEALQPHPNLYKLEFDTMYSPTWITTLVNLKSLKANVDCLLNPCMGDFFQDVGKLPFLEELTVISFGLDRLCLNNASPIAFPRLKKLKFEHCHNWQEWEDIKEEENDPMFPSLQELRLIWCPDLKVLPDRLLTKVLSLKSLHIQDCSNLTEHYNKESGSNRHYEITIHPKYCIIE